MQLVSNIGVGEHAVRACVCLADPAEATAQGTSKLHAAAAAAAAALWIIRSASNSRALSGSLSTICLFTMVPRVFTMVPRVFVYHGAQCLFTMVPRVFVYHGAQSVCLPWCPEWVI